MAQQQQPSAQRHSKFEFPQRTFPMTGSPRLGDPSKVKIVYNAELHRPCCEAYELADACLKKTAKCLVKECPGGGICMAFSAPAAAPATILGCACTMLCSVFLYPSKPKLDYKRSYVYVRENAVESNRAVKFCFGPCTTRMDVTDIIYFDHDIFAKKSSCSPFGCHFHVDEPKVVAVDTAFMCCGKILACPPCASMADAKPRLQPAVTFNSTLAAPYCCITNEVNKCLNFCELCGHVTGSPLQFLLFEKFMSFPAVKNTDAFVKATNDAIAANKKARNT
eukprot:m.22917 g.22917  ORF g.22917 m.22917 type:complete len:279 (+) comp12839_c0_seq1:368-1204(+)